MPAGVNSGNRNDFQTESRFFVGGQGPAQCWALLRTNTIDSRLVAQHNFHSLIMPSFDLLVIWLSISAQ